ncbi:GH92 family glycosyl hydrolase [Myceligenerans pegani]|uniref:GH92 family glycosyl hydrolase n=1 Tax=Myceligenerans pegani TaxID=2776917 RepID=A0ABR9N1A2_9MICO|nr:GH92 family glycosyl hydrolase [Myceligenerans sp. TRM 65318]MBE1877437.1 GH92 family glycosyl hydrolase [Myceligenerans sp. TRM 65318]MBE3019708.1 GH92 family glycosyl hydrolase [Myceligenerans sp. TRM 65318]
MRLTHGGGPEHVPAGRPGVGLTSVDAWRATWSAPGCAVVLDGLDVLVTERTELVYAVLPVLDDALTYAATHVAMDCLLDDGSWLSEAFAHDPPRDRYGFGASAAAQGAAKILLPDHWNLVRVDLAPATGRRVRAIAVTASETARTPSVAWFDAIELTERPETGPVAPVDLVDTRRGTHSTGVYSRGNTSPITSLPNGFCGWTPLTDGASGTWPYSWAAHNGRDNRPRLHGVAVTHAPSPWMGDRNQLAFHPVSHRPGRGAPDASLAARALPFSHDAETARPHHYAATTDDGHRVEVAPTAHGGVLRFTFPPGAAVGHVVIDAVSDDGAGPDGPVHVEIDPATGTLTGWSDHGGGLSTGRSRMYVAGRFDRPPVATGRADGDRRHAVYATFPLAEGAIEARVATSYISLEQARRALGAETGVPLDGIVSAARERWAERLDVLEVEGATREQRVTLYGGLYRLNLYPSSYWEDTPDGPAHASPVRDGAPVLPGKLYVNHGFWDTYRTCWPAYALLHPDVAAELADGFVQQYREGGWIARWSSPGYADLMTGTSSDVAFAGLDACGVALPDRLGTYEAGLRNATTVPGPDDPPGAGRKGQAHALLHGWVPRDVPESVSWTLEGCVNDAALAGMAERLAEDPDVPEGRRRSLRDEAAWLRSRAAAYLHLFRVDGHGGFFRGRAASGVVRDDAFDPGEWGGDYTETDAWNFAFGPLPGAAAARLHGGRRGLAAALDRFFATPERADKPGTYGGVIHEMVEARDVRMGQLGQSNQPSHHIPWTWLYAGRPDRAARTVREILDRLYTGSEIGQGYHGDEDNGEMSAWYVLSALGLYPLDAGSGRWAVGAPLFERVVLHRPDGDLEISAPGAPHLRYVDGFEIGGQALDGPQVDHAALVAAGTVRVTLAAEPSSWGTDTMPEDAAPDSAHVPWRDVSGAGEWRTPDGRTLPGLADDDLTTAVAVGPGTLEWAAPAGFRQGELRAYTLVSAADGAPPPSSWTVRVRDGAGRWRTVDERSGEEFGRPGRLRPFVPRTAVAGDAVRVDLHDAGALAQIELLTESR